MQKRTHFISIEQVFFFLLFGFLRHEGKNAVLLLLIPLLAPVKEDPEGDFDQRTGTGWICG